MSVIILPTIEEVERDPWGATADAGRKGYQLVWEGEEISPDDPIPEI